MNRGRLTGRLLLSAAVVTIIGLLAAQTAAASAAGAAGPGPGITAIAITLLGAIVGGAAIYALLRVDPAWPLSLGIALTVFSGNWGALGAPPLDRAVLALGLASLLGRHLMGATGLRLRLGPVHGLLAATLVYGAVSAHWAGTLGEADSYFGLIDQLGALPFALFLLAPIAFRTAGQRLILMGTLTVLGAYLGVTAILETIDLDALIWPSYIADPGYGLHPERARGPFAESAANGLALLICGVAAVLTARGARLLEWRWFAYASAGLCALATLLTLTRAIWVGTALGIVVAMLAARELRRYLMPLVLASAAGVVLALALVPTLAETAATREGESRPVWDRLNLIEAGGNMVADKPLFGFGWNRSERDAAPYFRQADEFPLTDVNLRIHNVFLSNAVELGLIGASLWLMGLMLAIGGAALTRGPPELRPYRVGLIAIAVQWAVVANFVPLFFLFPNLVLWTWAGMVSCWYVERVVRPSRRDARSAEAPRPRATAPAGA